MTVEELKNLLTEEKCEKEENESWIDSNLFACDFCSAKEQDGDISFGELKHVIKTRILDVQWKVLWRARTFICGELAPQKKFKNSSLRMVDSRIILMLARITRDLIVRRFLER